MPWEKCLLRTKPSGPWAETCQVWSGPPPHHHHNSSYISKHTLNSQTSPFSDRNHMIVGTFPSYNLSSISSVTSLLTTALPVSTTNEAGPESLHLQNYKYLLSFTLCLTPFLTSQIITVGGAIITTTDIAATNGLIHVIDKVHSSKVLTMMIMLANYLSFAYCANNTS